MLLRQCEHEKIERAVTIVRNFAAEHGWEEYCTSFDQTPVQIAQDQASLCTHLRDIGELDDDPPPGLIAVVLTEMVIVVDEDDVNNIRPEYLEIDDGWVRLIAHEFAHLLHEAIVSGDEEKLGPRWFFEGFACMAAGQTLGRVFDTESPEQVLEAVKLECRGQYAAFEAAVRYFCQRYDLADLVERAGNESFEQWLLQ
ncbi:MAG: hypothetical protein QNK31_00305 [Porticoccus sp.]|nr:hypothetical protein [Porticoccus sp.]